MPTITKVSFGKKNANRVNIYLDDSFFMACFADIAVKNGLKVGLEIDEDIIRKLLQEEEKEKAWNKALGYIAKFVKTEKEVRDYLKKKEFSFDATNYAINKLKEYKYLNDEMFINSFINSNKGTRGIKDIKQRLISKGINKDIALSIEIEDEVKTNTACKIALKYMKNRVKNKENYYKLSNFLYSKGIEQDDITTAVNCVFESKNFED